MDKVITPRRKFTELVNPRKSYSTNDRDIIELILMEVTKWYDIKDVSLLATKSREHAYVPARHLSMALIRRYTTYSLKNIGELFKRDHSTVLHAREAVRDACDVEDPIIYPAWKSITEFMSIFPIRNH